MGINHHADRTRRISSLLQRELARIIQEKSETIPNQLISISAVRTSRDLRQATVYISSLNIDEPALGEQTIATLNEMAGELRWELSRQLNLRLTPELCFKRDDSIRQGNEVYRILKEINDKDLEQ